jgi:hypothetical protein
MWRLTRTVQDNAGGGSLETSGSDAFLGLGMELTLSPAISFRGDVTRYGTGDLDINAASASVILRMP